MHGNVELGGEVAAIWGEMSSCIWITALVASTSAAATTISSRQLRRQTPSSASTTRKSLFINSNSNSNSNSNLFLLRVTNEGSRRSELELSSETSEADRIVDGINFGELCNEFECFSSPLVESTARQLVRDILELRQGNRALGTFAVSVKYKDPVRSFSGRDKYKRPLWITTALQQPSVSVQEMRMLSTSVLSIKWTVKGKLNNIILGADLTLKINSLFTLNQISGQVIEHQELWDLSASSNSLIAQAYFWTSRRLFASIEGGKDLSDLAKTISTRFSPEKQNMEIYPDPSGDPTKFFQKDDGFQRDVYQIALFLALIYLVVQFLRTTL